MWHRRTHWVKLTSRMIHRPATRSRSFVDHPGCDELAAVFANTWADAAPATWNRNRAAVPFWLEHQNRWNAPGVPPALETAPRARQPH
jgi:hypothetical protein